MKVNETRVRSLLKTVSFRIIEIVTVTVIFLVFMASFLALGLVAVLELTCFALHYCFKRAWNKVNFRRVIG